MPGWDNLILASYLLVVGLLAVFGAHRLGLILIYYGNARRAGRILPPPAEPDLPRVLIQLPLFNERYVAERLIMATAAIDYPRELLEVQVLDDSTDDTVRICRAVVHALAQRGLDIKHVRRSDRVGYKAGALAYGLRLSSAPLVAVFDADFIPPRSFLRDLVGHFSNPEVGMVQARWGHLNRGYSLLTRVQAIMLDGHFVMEHGARHRGGRFFNFNGTAGIWRRKAIDDGGGWSHDTLTEDLDLSIGAQMAGWRFVYVQGLECPAELPVSRSAFRSQQHRWSKGSIETARKRLVPLWRARLPVKVKLETSFHLLNNLAHPLMILLVFLLPLSMDLRARYSLGQLPMDGGVFVCATLSLMLFYGLSQREVGGRWWWRLISLPFALSVGIALCVNNTTAVWEALRGQRSAFIRTPKSGSTGQRAGYLGGYLASRRVLVPVVELLLGGYLTVAVTLAAVRGMWASVPFLMLFQFGFLYLGAGTLIGWFLAWRRREEEQRPRPQTEEPEQNSVVHG